MKQLKPILTIAIIATLLFSNACKKKDSTPAATTTPTTSAAACIPDSVFTPTGTGPFLVFKFQFDSNQVRLGNTGLPEAVGAGNAAQSPKFNFMSQHYIELAQDSTTALGAGKVLYTGPTTTAGGASAIDYCASIVSRQGSTFFSIPLNQITPGNYKWLRVSLAYQNYNITYKSQYLPGNGLGTGTLASFIGVDTYIKGYQINGVSYTPSASVGGSGNHLQGYWGFVTPILGTNYFYDGQVPAGGTTVPNPLFATSPIPSGSCVVTGKFVDTTSAASPLVIPSNPTQNIYITVSLSINKSFEWHEINNDGYYQPEIGEYAVDMGIRGLKPIHH